MPLAPILMVPSYRCAPQTPWGGSSLRELFHKNIPSDVTGESLELSAIPGLESQDEEGNTLSALIERYGQRLTGTAVNGPFPLLLKLLDARETLSVQVHPDDEYAAQAENKLGKTEAWYILAAKPGAELVYGVNAGVTKEELQAASQAGAAVEGLLRRVPVKAGETYYIPAGMVHAIGAGILLYEIQQSSDITYRFYDWERQDAQGNKRQLHIRQAIDVTDVNAQLDAAKEVKLAPGHFRLLDEKYFCLERLENFSGVLPANAKRFAIITAVEDCDLAWEKQKLHLSAGRTALLPADGYDLAVAAKSALISYPNAQ